MLQPQLVVNAPGDAYEREADSIAKRVVPGPLPQSRPPASAHRVTPPAEKELQTAKDEIEPESESLDEEHQAIQPSLAAPAVPPDDGQPLPPAFQARLEASRGRGRPLPLHLQAYFSPCFGWNMSGVRIHADVEAAALSRHLRANAFTHGRDIYFAAGRYAPESTAGQRLLAHELTHVVHQERGAPGLVQRDFPSGARQAPATDPIVTQLLETENVLVMRQWVDQGVAQVTYFGQPWILIQWEPDGQRKIDNLTVRTLSEGRRGRLRIEFNDNFRAQVFIDRSVEQQVSDRSGMHLIFEHRYAFSGNIHFNQRDGSDQTVRSPGTLRHDYVPVWLEAPDLIGIERLSDEPEEQAPVRRQRVWTFNSLEMIDQFAANHPDTVWAGIETAEGQFVAYALTREARARMAEVIREGRSDFETLGDYPGGRVVRYYDHGERLESLEALSNLYYRSEGGALRGTDVDTDECEVYQMGGGFYGRKNLRHTQALARWRELDGLTYQEILALETQPGQRFVSLRARTPGGLHELGWSYFQARREFFQHLDDWNTANLVYRVGHEEEGGQTPLNFFITHMQRMGPLVRHYLLTETSRTDGDPRFREAIGERQHLASAIADEVLMEVENIGQRFAFNALRDYVDTMTELANSQEAMQRFILSFPQMNEQRQYEALSMLGISRVPEGSWPFMMPYYINPQVEMIRETLADPESAMQLALGVDEGLISIEILQGYAQSSAASLSPVLEKLRNREIVAVRLEGELGEQVRAYAYRRMGFNLDPAKFPHHDVTEGFLPSALSGQTSDFTNVAEQMYANRVSHLDHGGLLASIVIGTAVVAGIVLLILVSNAAGVAAASYFGGGAVTEVVVSGLTFTALSEVASQALTGRGAVDWDDPAGSAARLGSQAGINILTFGFFRLLNTTFAAVSSAGVQLASRGVPALRGAGAVRATAGVLRITGVGLSFIGLSLAEFRVRHGRNPDDEELILLVHQSLTMLAMLEVGGALSRPYMQRLGLWARPNLPPELARAAQTLRSDIHTLRMDLASLAVRPKRAPLEGPRLLERHEAILNRQRELVEQLRSSLRTRGEASRIDQEAAAEFQIIDNALAQLRQAKFLAEADIRPRGRPGTTDELEFTYRPGAEEHIRAFYNERNVQGPDAQGVLRIQHQGRQLIYRPQRPGETLEADAASAALAERGQTLRQRQLDLLARAERLGVTGDSINAIQRGRLLPQRSTNPRALDRAERLIQAAERHVTRSVRERAQNALLRHIDRLGNQRLQAGDRTLASGEQAGVRRLGREVMDRLRSGPLESMTDQQVGEALLQVPTGVQGLGEAQLRGILYAAQGPPSGSSAEAINVGRIFTLERSAFERNFVLETFAQLMDARIPGTYEVLSATVSGRNNWRGGTWMFVYARLGLGINRLARFEVSVIDPRTGRERIYDLVTTDGQRLELKDWARWFPDSLKSQFQRDILLNTNGLTDPTGLSNIRWVFRAPAPRTEAEIRSTMREALEELLQREDVPIGTRIQLRTELALNRNLIEISSVNPQRTSAPAPQVGPPSPVLGQPQEKER